MGEKRFETRCNISIEGWREKGRCRKYERERGILLS